MTTWTYGTGRPVAWTYTTVREEAWMRLACLAGRDGVQPGTSRWWDHQTSLADARAAHAIARGVPPDRIAADGTEIDERSIVTMIELTTKQREALELIVRYDREGRGYVPATDEATTDNEVNMTAGLALWDADLVCGVATDAGKAFVPTVRGRAWLAEHT